AEVRQTARTFPHRECRSARRHSRDRQAAAQALHSHLRAGWFVGRPSARGGRREEIHSVSRRALRAPASARRGSPRASARLAEAPPARRRLRSTVAFFHALFETELVNSVSASTGPSASSAAICSRTRAMR